jgi:multiple sugar transport system substrate-binding protein
MGSDAIEASTLTSEGSTRSALYGLPIGRSTNHLHVWRSLLERAGFRLEDIPKEWEPFWSFWCDKVQPAVRKAMGRNDIWGVGLVMSVEAGDTWDQAQQFMYGYGTIWWDRSGRSLVDDPKVRTGLIKAVDSYTTIWRKGCTPPDAVDWLDPDNNKAFLSQRVVMTPNVTLSIPNALKTSHPDDYYKHVATVQWPVNVDGQPLAITGNLRRAFAFESGGHADLAKGFVRFLVEENGLAEYLDASRERLLPPMRKLVEQPFWLDPSDPHRMVSAIQTLTQPRADWELARSRNWRFQRVYEAHVLPEAIHRVATKGITPERAVDEAIARIKQLLSE